MKLDLSALGVESFAPAADGDPTQSGMMIPPTTCATLIISCAGVHAPTPDTSRGCVDR